MTAWHRQDPRMARTSGRGSWPVVALGVVIALIGLVLGAGGAWLVALGGSWYYLLAGLALVVSGLLLVRGRASGGWLYVAVFAATVVWALWEVGLAGWPLLPRVFAPTVILVLVLAAMPTLRPAPLRWPAAIAGIVAVLVVVLGGFTWLFRDFAEPSRQAALPQPGPAAMADPSPLATGADWPAYGGTTASRRYSPLAEINRDTVGSLERAFVFNTGDLPEDLSDNKYGSENTPLKIGDTLYLCTPMSLVIAIDAATGEERWRFDPEVPEENIPYTAACRGVAYFEVPDAGPDELCARRIVEGTLDGRLIALDAATGARCTGFGENGEVDIKVGMGDVVPGMVSITSAPTIVRGIVVTGHQVLDGQTRSAPSGVIQGFDAVTGAFAWGWDAAASTRTERPSGDDTWPRGTPNMWTTASGDEALGQVYLPMGNSAVDYWSSDRRPGSNEFATSLVAIDVTTGRPVWHFQTVHMDVWDYDLGSQATLVDYPGEGGTVPALILPSKQGDLYVLDRRTGAPLTPVEERPVPQGGVEPDQRTPSQPFSLFHTLAKRDLDEADMWGMSPIDQMICRINFRRAAYDGIYTPPESERRWIQYPGYNGGSDWGGIAVDPTRGVIVANYNDMPNYNRLVPRAEADALGWAPRGEARGDFGGAEGAGDPQAGTPFGIDVNAGWRMPFTKLLCKEPPYGGIRAIDIATGETIWDRPLGEARKNGPFDIPSMLPIEIGTPNNGGAVVTAGGLVFIAAATDDLIRAIDLETGETLWQDVLPGGGQATPMTYEADGRQYLVITAGGHHFMETPVSDAVIAYALPRR